MKHVPASKNYNATFLPLILPIFSTIIGHSDRGIVPRRRLSLIRATSSRRGLPWKPVEPSLLSFLVVPLPCFPDVTARAWAPYSATAAFTNLAERSPASAAERIRFRNVHEEVLV